MFNEVLSVVLNILLSLKEEEETMECASTVTWPHKDTKRRQLSAHPQERPHQKATPAGTSILDWASSLQ